MLLGHVGLQYHRRIPEEKHVHVDQLVFELGFLQAEVLQVLLLGLDLFAGHFEGLDQLLQAEFLDSGHVDDHRVRRELFFPVELELEAPLRESLAEA